MSNNIRDSKFINFAHELYMECATIYQEALIKGRIDGDQLVIQHMARHVYDLVRPSVENIAPNVTERYKGMDE